MSGIEDDPGPCVCTDCQNAREQGTSETEPLAGTTSYMGVIRGADEAEALAEALTRIERLWDVIRANGDTNARLMRERDKARAEVEGSERELDRVRAERDAANALLDLANREIQRRFVLPPHNDPEFGFDKTAALSDPGEEGVSESVAQHVCDCPRHVAYRENLAANTTTPMCLVHPDHFMPCLRCLGYGCTACDGGVQAADDRRSL